MNRATTQQTSGIRDNCQRGRVADFLIDKLAPGSDLSVVSAYFTLYAYEALSAQLDSIGKLHFLFGEPRFIATLDPERTDKKSFKIEDEGQELVNRLQQKEIVRRCARWISEKVEIRSIRQANLLHGSSITSTTAIASTPSWVAPISPAGASGFPACPTSN